MRFFDVDLTKCCVTCKCCGNFLPGPCMLYFKLHLPQDMHNTIHTYTTLYTQVHIIIYFDSKLSSDALLAADDVSPSVSSTCDVPVVL